MESGEQAVDTVERVYGGKARESVKELNSQLDQRFSIRFSEEDDALSIVNQDNDRLRSVVPGDGEYLITEPNGTTMTPVASTDTFEEAVSALIAAFEALKR